MKSYIIKTYTPSGTYVATVNEKIRLSRLSFKSQINGGQGNLNITVASPFDTPPVWAVLNNFVKVYIVEAVGLAQIETLIYSGFISEIEHTRDGSQEYMSLSVLSLSGLLAIGLYQSGGSYNVVKNTDPATIASDIVLDLNAILPNSWITAGSNVVAVGTTAGYTFKKMTRLDALDQALKMSGENYYWHIGGDGELYFKQLPATATHKFNIAKHINRVTVRNSLEEITNQTTVAYSGGTKTALDLTSQGFYFKRDSYIDKEDLNATGAQNEANFTVLKMGEPKLKTEIEINSTYPIESIRPGETCSVYGLSTGSTVLGDNMIIVGVTYNEQTVTLELSEDFGNFGDQLSRFLEDRFLAKKIY